MSANLLKSPSQRSHASLAMAVVSALVAPITAHAQVAGWDTTGDVLHTSDVSQSGGARVPIPIDLPPGRSGITPTVNLTWSTQDGNSPDFNGYITLGLPSIERRKPIANDDRFIYRVDGSVMPLVRCRPDQGPSRCTQVAEGQEAANNEYRLERDDGSGLRFFLETAADNGTQWASVNKAGLRTTYGAEATARLTTTNLGTAKWNISRTVDPAGNAIFYTWVNQLPSQIRYTGHVPGTDKGRYVVTFVQKTRGYPFDDLDWRSSFPGNAVRVTQYIDEVKVEEDPSSGASSTGWKPISRLVFSLLIGVTGGPGSQGSETYFDRYGYSTDGTESLPRRTTVTTSYEEVIAPGGALNLSGMLPGSLLVGDFNGDGRQDIAVATSLNLANWLILLGTGSASTDGGFVVANWDAPLVPAPYTVPDPLIARALDLDGDGITDLINWDSAQGKWHVLLGTGTGFTEQWWDAPKNLNGFLADDLSVMTGDFNGDGKADLAVAISSKSKNGQNLEAPVHWRLHLSTGIGFTLVDWTLSGDYLTFSFADLTNEYGKVVNQVRVVAGDFNGDRRTDLAWYRNSLSETGGTSAQWFVILTPPTLVSGNVTPIKWNGPNGPWLPPAPTQVATFQVLSGDFNGDGLTDIDLVYCDYDPARPVLSRYQCTRHVCTWNGAGLAEPAETGGAVAYTADTWPNAVIAGDFDGDGRTEVEFAVPSGPGVVWRNYIRLYPTGTPNCEPTTPPGVECIPAFTGLYGSSTSPAPSCLRYIPGDFNGSGRTDMACIHGDYRLSAILDQPETLAFKNDTGGSLRYVLGGASRYNTAPTAEATPLPVNPLPFPVSVVTSKTEDDGLGHPMETIYGYSGSHTDIAKGEFRGFRAVDEIGPGSQVVKSTEYHRGAFAATGEEEDFRGRPQRMVRWVTVPTELMQQVDFDYTRNQTGALEAKVVLPASITTTDVNRDYGQRDPIVPGSQVVKTEAFVHDAYGNRTKTTISGTGGPTLVVDTPFKEPMALANGDLVHLVDLTRTWSDSTLLMEKNYVYYQATDLPNQQGKLKKVTQTYCGRLDSTDVERLAGCFDPAVVLDYDTEGRLANVQEATSDVDFRTVASIVTTEDGTENGNGIKVTVSRQADGVTFTRTTHQDWRFGKQDQVTDENGKVDKTTYDPFGRLSSQISSLNDVTLSSTSVEYVDQNPDGPSYRTTTTQLAASEFSVTREYVDGLGRVIRTVTSDASGGSTAYLHTVKRYDGAGRLLGVMGPFRAATNLHTAAPPAAGFPWSRIDYGLDGIVYGLVQSDGTRGTFGTDLSTATGPTTTLSYFGQVTTVTDPDGVVTETTRDFAGRIVEVVERGRSAPGGSGHGVPTDYSYRADGLLLSVLGPEGSCHDPANPLGRCLLSEIKYDPLGRRIEVRDPTFKDPAAVQAQGAAAPSLPWQYFYAANGALDHVVAPSGTTTSYRYDGFDRPTSKCFSAPGVTTCDREETYSYDQTWDADTNSVDHGLGRLGSVAIEQGGVQLLVDRLHYDAMGRFKAVARTLAGWSGTQVTRFGFDLGGRLQTLTYPDDTVLSYVYHPGSARLSLLSGSALGAGQQVTVPQYDPLGSADRVTTDVQANYIRDPWSGQLWRIKIGPGGDGTIADIGYGPTAAGRIGMFSDYRLGQLIGATPAKVDFIFGYDDVARLTGETVSVAIPGDLSRSAALLYDPVVGRPGGLNSITDPLRGAFGYSYDKDGNTTIGVNLSGAAPSWRSFTYGADGMPSAIGALAAFYDEEGQRAIKGTCGAATCPVASTTFYFGPHYEVRNGVPIRYVFALGQRIAKVDASGTAYVHKDHRDSTVAVTRGGATIWRGSYQLFGALRTECADGTLDACAPNVAVTRPVPYLFGDHEYDEEVGLYYFGARYYDPVVGRFTSPDTIIPRPFDPQAYNRYAFLRNDPVNRVDPDGHGDCNYMLCVQTTSSSGNGTGSPGWDQPDTFEGTFGGWGGYGYYSGGYSAPPPPQPIPATLGTTGPSGSGSQQVATVVSSPSGRVFRSHWVLRAIVPGQVAWDNAMTELINGDILGGAGYAGAMLGEQVLATLLVVKLPAIPTLGVTTKGVASGGAAAISVGEKGLAHVLARHFPGGAQAAGKSLFNAGESVAALVRGAEQVAPVLQQGRNFQRVVNAGRVIGIDRVTGLGTRIYTVITDAAGNLITMFPGTP